MEADRLACIADKVKKGNRLADIGTDHAHLPVTLVRRGICPSAIASDIRKGPVQAARRSVEEAGLTKQIAIRLGDGLSTVSPEECDTIVIAGMGGETAATILSATPWIKNSRYQLLIQPMTHPEDIRRWLWENGFTFSETVVREGRHLYTVLDARFIDKAIIPSAALCLTGTVSPDEQEYLDLLRRRLQKQRQGLSAAGKDTTETDALLAHLTNFGKELLS